MTRDPHPVFRGSIVALPTPFRADDEANAIDFGALNALIERQIEAGTDGLVLGGSTGESTALTDRERLALFEYAVGAARRRVPVIAGVGLPGTRAAAQLALDAERVGVDALLVTTPAYSRPTQEGLRRHFAAIARATTLPISLYNIPGRTCVDLEPESVALLAEAHANIVAIKEASDSLDRLRVLIELGCVEVLCGDDRWIPDALELGAAGAVSVVANVAPRRVAELVHAFDAGANRAQAPELVESLAPLIRVLGIETNPGPLKAALALLGLGNGTLRLPLVTASAENQLRIRDVIVTLGFEG